MVGVVATLGAVGAAGFLYGSRASDDGDNNIITLQDEPLNVAGSDGADDGDDSVDTAAEDPVEEGEDATSAEEGTDPVPATGPDDGDDEQSRAPRPNGMDFLADGVDQQGRPLPALPRFLAANTKNPEELASYHPDPDLVPESGPYVVVKGGFIFLRGSISSENLRQELIRRNLLVLSRDNLLIEMEIDGRDQWYLDQPIPHYFEDEVVFDVGESELQLDVLTVFLRFAQLIDLGPDITLQITGHTDNIGDDASNLRLSEERVAIVKDAFVQLGVPEVQILTDAKGEAEPIATNDTAEGRAANRRVEFSITYPAGGVIES